MIRDCYPDDGNLLGTLEAAVFPRKVKGLDEGGGGRRYGAHQVGIAGLIQRPAKLGLIGKSVFPVLVQEQTPPASICNSDPIARAYGTCNAQISPP